MVLRKVKMEFPKMNQRGRSHPLVSDLTERRKHPRIPLRLPTEYFPEGKTRSRLCHTINIGEGGVLLCLPEKLQVGQRLKIEVFYYFDYELEKFYATGEVVWAENLEDAPTGYRSALEFVDLSLRDFEKLKKFLRKIFY
jgi:c-di-GMP-binding flagellar brake protein YcgR